ncbi:hypothetical protein Hypma_000536 [Hypsizygus marmoreus]|uniref:Allergen n=1 Tax=Hypsizygus marmoreus TaxID=39966 RepID=A0A369JFW5_HYPMA|nr:hypothetical protein Hypma_000536 [Hypsizygus marmoreus]
MSTGPRKLPPGTGPGTSGKPAPPQESSAARGKSSTGFANAPVDPDKEPDSHERGTATGRSANQASSAARGAGPTGSAFRPHGAPLDQGRGAQPITKPGQLTAGTGANESEGGLREAPPSTTQQTSVDRGSVPTEFDSGAATTGVNRPDVQNRDMTSSSPPRPPGLTPPGVQSEEAISDHPLGSNQLGDSHKAGGIQVIPHPHTTGHSQATTAFAESDDQTLHETHQLNPVTHERVRHVEVEEVTRQKEHDRHIHHIQHHTQPVMVFDTRPEQHHDKASVHPVTKIQERHANSAEEKNVLESQVRQRQDSVEHEPKERVVVDKGTKVHENIQHHIHHVVQPIIEKESIDRSRIHTVIPIHQVSHEIPVIREPRILAPVSIDGFVETQAGTMSGDLKQAQTGDTAHHCSSCTCGVGKLGESLDRDLRVGDSAPGLSINRGGPNESPEDGH